MGPNCGMFEHATQPCPKLYCPFQINRFAVVLLSTLCSRSRWYTKGCLSYFLLFCPLICLCVIPIAVWHQEQYMVRGKQAASCAWEKAKSDCQSWSTGTEGVSASGIKCFATAGIEINANICLNRGTVEGAWIF